MNNKRRPLKLDLERALRQNLRKRKVFKKKKNDTK